MPKPRHSYRTLLPTPLFALVLGLTVACLQPNPLRAQTTATPTFSQIVIFGDSLSDTGNDANVAKGKYGIRFPGPGLGTSLSYTDGRFTDGTDSDPAATLYSGVWHEQLAALFLGLTPANASSDGGTDYAFGGATTESGQSTLTEGAEGVDTVSINVDNMGRQVSTYLGAHPAADPAALYIVWGGANDLFTNADGANVTNAAARETTLVRTLAEAGAKTFIVPNLPPLGYTPNYNTSAATSAAFNQVSLDFATQLSKDLDDLETVLAGENLTVTIHRLDVYTLFMNLHDNPEAYGFANIVDPSQGTDANPDTYIFWDKVHPTTAGHFQLAAEAYTLLTGVPVIEVNSALDKSGVFFTRTGTDLTKKLVATYAAVGTAIEGTDYAELTGKVKIKPGKQTAEVTVTPRTTDTGRKVKLKLLPGTTYVRPPVKKAVIKLP